MESEFLEHCKKRLWEEKERLEAMISRIEETGIGETMSNSVGELSAYDNHPGDLGDVMFERSKDMALRDNEHVLLEEVESALQKIDDGTYGICDECSKSIDVARLEALPWSTHCIHCQREDDGSDTTRRPLEEEILSPPFSRTFLDSDKYDTVGFDGEDALQAVLRWGSSDTPQDLPGTDDYEHLYPNSNEHRGIVDLVDAIPSKPELGSSPRK